MRAVISIARRMKMNVSLLLYSVSDHGIDQCQLVTCFRSWESKWSSWRSISWSAAMHCAANSSYRSHIHQGCRSGFKKPKFLGLKTKNLQKSEFYVFLGF